MSYLDRTKHIHKFGGDIWYVNAGMAASGNGKTPDQAFKTVTEGVTASSSGDMINVATGTYVENIVLGEAGVKDSLELYCETGVVLDGTGTCLTMAGNYCSIYSSESSLVITPASGQTGVSVTGNFCNVADIRASCNSTADIGIDVAAAATGTVIHNCRPSNPLIAAFKVQGDKTKIYDSNTGGEPADTSIGYWVTNTCNKCRIFDCSSQGHATAGIQVDDGCTNGSVVNFNSGGGDGAPIGTTLEGWSWDIKVDDEVFHTTDISAPTAAGYDNLFKVTGSVNITFIYGDVKEAIDASVDNIKLTLDDGASTDITGNVDTASAPVKSLFIKTKLAANGMELMSSAAASINESSSERKGALPFIITAKEGSDTFIRAVWSGADSVGEIHWHCHWEKVSEDGFVEGV